MPTTPRGIIYPDATGSTELWDHYEALASSTDTAIDDAIAGFTPVDTAETAVVGGLTAVTTDADGLFTITAVPPAKGTWTLTTVLAGARTLGGATPYEPALRRVTTSAASADFILYFGANGPSANNTVTLPWLALFTRTEEA